MRHVAREDLVDRRTYEEGRDAFRASVMREKARRRVHVGPHLTFLFENALTMRYQVQEMMRAEGMDGEREIRHELDTYNAVLGEPGELPATLLVEIDDPGERRERLREWVALPGRLYVLLEDGTKVRPRFDAGQVSDGKISSVQYLLFPVAGRVPTAVGVDLEGMEAETAFTDDTRRALAEDLAGA